MPEYPKTTPQRFRKVWTRISRAEIGLISAGVAFFGFLAIFPALGAVISIWGFAFDPIAIQSQLELTEGFLPDDAYDLISGQVQRMLAVNNRHLGLATLLPTLLAIWSARAGVAALIDGLNAIHGYPGRLGHLHVLRALAMTFVLVGLALATMALTIIAPLVIRLLPLGPAQAEVLAFANFGLGLLLVTVGIGVFYRFGPNRPPHRRTPRFFTPGLLISIVLWAVVSRALVYYLSNFPSYNQVYGSIGAVVALMFWFYISAYAVLLGAAVDAERAAEAREARGEPPANSA